MTPERPPITNIERKPSANSIGVLKWSFPPQIVASQLKILIPVGTAISSVVIIIGTRSHDDMPLDEHVVRPDREAEHDDRHQRQRHQPVAEDRLPAEDGYDLAHDPEAGQHHDVDGRVRVEPEDVLVAERVAAPDRVEERRVHHVVEHREELRAGDERRRDHDEQ